MNDRKTKIVCTLGPATDHEDILRGMIRAGMNVARFNFSHGSHEEHEARLRMVRRICGEEHAPVAMMLDTKGPEIRLRNFAGGKAELKSGKEFTLTTENIEGDARRASVTYADLPKDVKSGDRILLDDGLISLRVREIEGKEIRCVIENSGTIKDHKGVNVPNVSLNMDYMSPQDRSDILFGIEQGYDFISASFVRTAEDVRKIRALLDEHGSRMQIIAKIENQSGIDHIAEILEASDGIMVARGDMGVELDFTEIPPLQKRIIRQCVAAGKPVITATQMLDSMIENPRPTRAEITDVANAIYDGTGAIMLSGETAAGKYPVEAVQTMDAIARRTEEDLVNPRKALTAPGDVTITRATAHAACTMARDTGAKAILTVSKGGTTARMVSSFRPSTPIIALLIDPQVQRQMSLYWGVIPLSMPNAKDAEQLVEYAVKSAEQSGLVEEGDLLVVTAGVPVGVTGSTNMIRILHAGDPVFTTC